ERERDAAASGGAIKFFFFLSSRRRHTRWPRDWSSDVCSSDLAVDALAGAHARGQQQRLQQPGIQMQLQYPGLSRRRSVVRVHRRSEERRVGKESRSAWRPPTSIEKT